MISVDKIIEQAVRLNLSGFKESLQLQSEDVKYSSQSFEQRLFQLFEAEINQRQDKRIKRFLNAAKLKDKLYHFKLKLNTYCAIINHGKKNKYK